MAIHSFLKAEKGDPDWQFSPDDYFGKEFKIIDASMVELEEGKEDQVILRQSPTEKDLLAKHLRISLQKDATLELIIINDVDPNLQQVFLYDVYIKSGANLLLGIFVKDGRLNKHIVQIHQDDHSVFTCYGIVSNTVGGDSEIITKIVHHGENSASNQLFLGVSGESSQTVLQGVAIIDEDALFSQANIESRNMVIAPGGRCYAKPEIYVNSEFSTSSQAAEITTISLERIGYLQSRGLDAESARNMIIRGFRDQVIDLLSDDAIKQEVKDLYQE